MESDITGKVTDYISRHGMIKQGGSVCVAVSGGADSMCLLFLLHDMADDLGITLSAVHVEHGIRGQASLDDMAFVKGECERLGIPVEAVRIDAKALAEETGTTLEEAARNGRYRVFSGIDADRIALAHHMNDQAETFLFNSVRGSGIRGLRGMEPVRGRYIRPLLCVTRREIEDFLSRRKISYRTDLTNEDLNIARNRIRHAVIPELLKVNDGALRHICETAEDAALLEDLLAEEAVRASDDCVIYGDGRAGVISVDLDRFELLHKAVAARVIKEALIRAAGRSKDIGRRHVEAVLSLARGMSGRHIDLIYGIKAYKEFRRLVIKPPGAYELSDNVYPKEDRVPEFTVLLKGEVSTEQILTPGSYTKYIDYATIVDASALTFRQRMAGDHISIKGGSKKLKDLLIEERIPKDRRDMIYLLAMGSEIVWIPELGRIGERFKVTEGTERILKMEIKNNG